MTTMKTAKKKPNWVDTVKPEVWKGELKQVLRHFMVSVGKGDWEITNRDVFASAASARRSAESLAKRLGISIRWEKA